MILLRVVQIVHTQKNIKIIFLVCIDNKFSKKFVLYRGKGAVYKFIKSILSEYNYCRKVIKNICVGI